VRMARDRSVGPMLGVGNFIRMRRAFFLAVVLCCGSAQAQKPMSTDAQRYLSHALDLIQKNSIKRQTNWAAMRSKAFSEAAGAQTPAETYAAIRNALRSLGDRHSHFLDPAQYKMSGRGERRTVGITPLGGYTAIVLKGSSADLAGVRERMKILSVDGKPVKGTEEAFRGLFGPKASSGAAVTIEAALDNGPPEKFSLIATQVNSVRMPWGRTLPGNIGYVDVPDFGGNDKLAKDFATRLQEVIRSLDGPPVSGWVVDLRRNGGGNMYPMIDGLGPLLGEGDLGFFKEVKGSDKWWYRRGRSGEGRDVFCKVDHPYKLMHPGQKVALLTSPYTASSGEATLISFLSMPNVRVFGEPTAGLTSGNETYELSDGALLVLTEAQEADRRGQVYEDAVQPDEKIAIDWAQFNTDRDPVVAAATRWISGR
jgi:carboxyl-terminal processing protease